MSELDILQFEFGTNGIAYGFVKVIDIFQHHFTGETMRHIRMDRIDREGRAYSEFHVYNEAEYKALVAKRIMQN